jgi:hypothetical protein
VRDRRLLGFKRLRQPFREPPEFRQLLSRPEGLVLLDLLGQHAVLAPEEPDLLSQLGPLFHHPGEITFDPNLILGEFGQHFRVHPRLLLMLHVLD